MFASLTTLFIFGATIYNYQNSLNTEIAKVKSDVDGRVYLVQNTVDRKTAANQLAYLRRSLETLVRHITSKYKDRQECIRLYNKFNPDVLCESGISSKHTSYTVNKGEKINFCLRQRGDNNNLVELNTLTFVAIHELAHVMSESVGHGPEFWKNFRFLLKEAISIDIYQYQDFREKPVAYCGTQITDTPYHLD